MWGKINQVHRIIMGGGLVFAILINLHSTELSTLCPPNTRCELTQDYPLITNHGTTIITPTGNTGYDGGIYIQKEVTSFINYGEIITNTKDGERGTFSFTFNGGQINALTNYGYISGGVNGNDGKSIYIVNYGTMGGVDKGDITLTNYGVIKPLNDNGGGTKYHFSGVNLTLQTSLMTINENASTFNAFSGTAGDDSHLVLKDSKSAKFENGNSKIILDFGSGFEFGAGYLFNKLVVDTSGNNALGVDFDRLMPKNDIYTLYKQGEYFIARLQPQHSAISNISKANIRTMNNFWTLSNSMIYPRKYNLVILRERSDRRISKSNVIDSSPKAQNDNIMLDSANHLKSYESFSYRNEAQNRRIQRQNKRNYNRKSQNLTTDSANRTRESQNLAQNPHDYYFILTPFINHNHFFESGRYNLSGFDYGFLTAFSAKVAESNHLGTHFIMSYGNLGDRQDKDLSIKSLNLNVGLNYKLDLIYDMYLKARGDFYYFSNALDSLTIKNIKPNNLGFGASVSYGKDFDFKSGGMLGIEAGLDYKALKTNAVSLNSQTYKQSLYNLIYADVGMNYNKYFGGFGINVGAGFKANLAPKLAESALILNTQTLKFTLDNDKYLGYANAGISYLLNTKNFDMEFSLAYYGNYGDRIISNAGGFEWRVLF